MKTIYGYGHYAIFQVIGSVKIEVAWIYAADRADALLKAGFYGKGYKARRV